MGLNLWQRLNLHRWASRTPVCRGNSIGSEDRYDDDQATHGINFQQEELERYRFVQEQIERQEEQRRRELLGNVLYEVQKLYRKKIAEDVAEVSEMLSAQKIAEKVVEMAETLPARECSRRNVVHPTAVIRPPDRNDPSHFWADGRTFTGTPANVPCPCGSGRRYRDCHQHNE